MSKLIDHFGIDTSNERNETIKVVSEIDNSTLLKMGFHKVDDCWVFLKSKTHREEHGGSNLNNDEGDDVVPMEDDTAQAAEQSCYEVHHTSSHRMESPIDHARSQRMRSHSTEFRGGSQAQQSMNEDVAATHHNALVAYQALEYRGEPNPCPCLRGKSCLDLMHCQRSKGPISRKLKLGSNILIIKLKEFRFS